MTADDIARQAREDDAEAMQDMARFARRVRRRLGLTQMEFARRLPHEFLPITDGDQIAPSTPPAGTGDYFNTASLQVDSCSSA